MKNKIWLTTFREIKNSLGRYLAFMIIVALGVGFFAGLKVTDPAMRQSINQYLVDNQFYDFRLISSYGFEKEDIARLEELLKSDIDVRNVEGAISTDVIVERENVTRNLKALSLSDKINTPVLVAGRMPEASNECVLDSNYYNESMIGQDIVLSSLNSKDTLERFRYGSYQIVGLVRSPLYIQYERGSTSLGNGVLDAFFYILEDGFDVDYATECYVKLDSDHPIFSDQYENQIDAIEDQVEVILDKVAEERYDRIVSEAQSKVDDAQEELDENKETAEKEFADAKKELQDAFQTIEENEKKLEDAKKSLEDLKVQIEKADAANALFPGAVDPLTVAYMKSAYEEGQQEYEDGVNKLEDGKKDYQDGVAEYDKSYAEYLEEILDAQKEIDDAQKEIEDLETPVTFLLDRNSNIGYVCFESDSSIVGGIANIFPLFFFLVAALVCGTTMNRMVEDQRTQIGILKALGYNDAKIMLKFLVYSGSSAFVGAILGFVIGTITFPKAIWAAYQMMYNTGSISYFFSLEMLLISFAVAFACSIGVTFVTCRIEVTQMAAGLMRPKAPKAGKRIFLERIPFVWNRLSFLRKVSFRNIFRYKSRLFMMVLGIGGCTALLVAGLGIYDSIGNIANDQYEEISVYDISVMLKDACEDTCPELDALGFSKEDYLVFYETSVTMTCKEGSKNVRLDVFEDDSDLDGFYDLHTEEGERISFPKTGEAVINAGLANQYKIKTGDRILLSSENVREIEVEVVGINQNFIYNYIYINRSTFESANGNKVQKKNVYLNVPNDADAHEMGARLLDMDEVLSVTVAVDMLSRVSNMMKSLNIIVYLVIACAAVLSFVVVYNLTNINISERVREIATIKVLGFYQGETASYVFRENVILSGLGALLGLVLGKYLHAFIMSEIVIDMITFDVRVKATSYCLAFVLAMIFTFIISLFMRRKLDEISMTESLKAVE